jgi:hypothetical protein
VGNELVVVLRANVLLQSDLHLARAELAALSGVGAEAVHDLTHADFARLLPEAVKNRSLLTRQQDPVALRVCAPRADAAERIVLRSAFGQEVFAPAEATMPSALSLRDPAGTQMGICLHTLLEVSDSLLKDIAVAAEPDRAIDEVVRYLLCGAPTSSRAITRRIDAALTRRNTLHLAHNLHVYKAKFFPRFVGALLNMYAPEKGGLLAEPFSGSGTALFEASTRGISSVGFDLDPISALISANKITPLLADASGLKAAVRDVLLSLDMQKLRPAESEPVRLPEEIRRRLTKRSLIDGVDWVAEIEEDATAVRDAIDTLPSDMRGVFDTLLSDALTKKVRYRFVGVGNGRYTFALTQERVVVRFRKKALELTAMAAVLDWVDRCVVTLGASAASVADARRLPLGDAQADVVVTSPPYLPASSGREHYALARAIPLSVLSVASPEELDALLAHALGSVPSCGCPPDPIMHAPLVHRKGCVLFGQDDEPLPDLPQHAIELLEFLRRDPQRRLKFKPTLDYLVALQDVLIDGMRILKPGGVYVLVLPRESIFYDSKTKEHLFVCRTAEMITDLASNLGFEHETTVDVELLKLGTPNARPRSSDAYFESAVVLRTPTPGAAHEGMGLDLGTVAASAWSEDLAMVE